MNKKISALILLTSVNCATPLRAMREMEEVEVAAAAETPQELKAIWQEVFNTHAVRLVPPPAPESSSSAFSFFSKKAPSPADLQKKAHYHALAAMNEAVKEANRSGVKLDILTVSQGGKTVWPAHEAAYAGHCFVGTVAKYYTEVLTQKQTEIHIHANSEFRPRDSSLKGTVEELAQEQVKKSGRIARLYEVHKALKENESLDTAQSSAIWATIVNDLASKEKSALCSTYGKSYLEIALCFAQRLDLTLGKQIKTEPQRIIFNTAVRQRNSNLALLAQKHGMVPSKSLKESATAMALKPRVPYGTMATLRVLLSKPAEKKEEGEEEE